MNDVIIVSPLIQQFSNVMIMIIQPSSSVNATILLLLYVVFVNPWYTFCVTWLYSMKYMECNDKHTYSTYNMYMYVHISEKLGIQSPAASKLTVDYIMSCNG